MKQRIQKLLSSSGICSRRQAEALIKEGRLTVNDEKSHLGQMIDHKDLVRIDGKLIGLSKENSKPSFNKISIALIASRIVLTVSKIASLSS